MRKIIYFITFIIPLSTISFTSAASDKDNELTYVGCTFEADYVEKDPKFNHNDFWIYCNNLIKAEKIDIKLYESISGKFEFETGKPSNLKSELTQDKRYIVFNHQELLNKIKEINKGKNTNNTLTPENFEKVIKHIFNLPNTKGDHKYQYQITDLDFHKLTDKNLFSYGYKPLKNKHETIPLKSYKTREECMQIENLEYCINIKKIKIIEPFRNKMDPAIIIGIFFIGLIPMLAHLGFSNNKKRKLPKAESQNTSNSTRGGQSKLS